MRILVLYSRLVPSWIPVFEKLVELGYALDVVHWDDANRNNFNPPKIEGVNYFKRSIFTYNELRLLFKKNIPQLIFISGWMDIEYLKIAFIARRKNIPVAFGCDNWWQGTARQWTASFIPKSIRRLLFSHAWIPGPRQYEFCKRLGYSDNEIIHNLLSCDADSFRPISTERKKRFIYVGRLSEEKGISTLVEAFQIYQNELNGSWEMLCVGAGGYARERMNHSGLKLVAFSDSAAVASLMAESSVFVMPSVRDFSPVAVHEAVCMGLPIILSEGVGNNDCYAVQNYNAMIFPVRDSSALARCFKRFELMSAEDIEKMGKNSLVLSLRNNPEITALSLVSII